MLEYSEGPETQENFERGMKALSYPFFVLRSEATGYESV